MNIDSFIKQSLIEAGIFSKFNGGIELVERTTKKIKSGTYTAYKEIESLLRSDNWRLIDTKNGEYEFLKLDEVQIHLSEVHPQLDKKKDELLKRVQPLIAKKKKLYSKMDITSPKSSDEKKLDREIADLFSQINQIIIQKRKMKTEINEGKFADIVKKAEIAHSKGNRKLAQYHLDNAQTFMLGLKSTEIGKNKEFINKYNEMRKQYNESVNEGIWPKSKLSDRFEFELSDELKKNFKGIFYVIGYDLYHNDKKVMTIDGDRDSVYSIIKKLKSKIKESVNEGISVFDERHFGKKGIIIMIDDNGKKVSAIFKDKRNADKYNRNKQSDVEALLKIAKTKPFGKAIDESINEAGIKYQKGKLNQSGNGWSVYKFDDLIQFDIKVNQSARWSTDVHDSKGETIKLMDAGKKRAILRFKEGNINNFAEQMYKLNDETTWGEKQGLTAKDYADVLRVWVDMKIYNNSISTESITESNQDPHIKKVGKDYYVDSRFVQHSNEFGTLEHIWGGEFTLKTPDGDVQFWRSSKSFPDFIGRSHKIEGDEKAIKRVVVGMIKKYGLKETVTEEIWTSQQKSAVSKLDSEFDQLLVKKGIEPHSKEASDLWRTYGFQKKFKKIFNKTESVNEEKNFKAAKQALIDFNNGKLREDDMVKKVIKSLGFKVDEYSEEEAGIVISRAIRKGKIPTDNYILNNVIDVLTESVNEGKRWFFDRRMWDKERRKLDVADDDKNSSKDSKGKVIALWYSNRNEGWIMKESTSEPKIITQMRDIMKSGYKKLKDPKSGRTMMVDSYSASAIVKVYDALNQQNKEKFVSTGLLGMQSMAFTLLKK